VDSAKHLLGIGGGYEAGWQIGAALRIAILSDVQVSLAEARAAATDTDPESAGRGDGPHRFLPESLPARRASVARAL
jgi:hypothetical protein